MYKRILLFSKEILIQFFIFLIVDEINFWVFPFENIGAGGLLDKIKSDDVIDFFTTLINETVLIFLLVFVSFIINIGSNKILPNSEIKYHYRYLCMVTLNGYYLYIISIWSNFGFYKVFFFPVYLTMLFYIFYDRVLLKNKD